MITTLFVMTLVLGLLILAGGIPKSATAKSHLEVRIDSFHLGCVERKDRSNPTRNILAVAVEDCLREQGITPLYIVAGSHEVRVALKDSTLVYKTTPALAGFLKAYNSYNTDRKSVV